MEGKSFICLDLPKGTQNWGAFPIKIYDTSGMLLKEGHSGEPIEVEPGRYLVSARLPNGEEQFSAEIVTAESGLTAEVEIKPPSKAKVNQMETRGNLRGPGRPKEGETLQSYVWTGRLFDAELMRVADGDLAIGPILDSREQHEIMVAPNSADQLLVMRYPDERIGPRVRLTVIPHDVCLARAAEVTPDVNMATTLIAGINPPNTRFASKVSTEANMLMGFVENSAFIDMQRVSESFVMRGAAAMQEEQMSVLLGALGAYVLLRVDALEGLEEWLDGMGERTDHLPDLPILRAELNARKGFHDKAIASLDTAISGPCPWFRSGFVYLADRLRQYIAIHDSKADNFRLPDPERFRAAREKMELHMTWLVPGPNLLTFDLPLHFTGEGAQ